MSNESSILSQKKKIANIITLIILIVGIVFIVIGIKNNNEAKSLINFADGYINTLDTQSKNRIEECQKTAKITIPLGCLVCVGGVIYKLHSKSSLLANEGNKNSGK